MRNLPKWMFWLMAWLWIMPVAQSMALYPSWQYFKAVNAEKPGFALIRIDPDIMANSQYQCPDVRLTDANGKEIPSQLVQPGENVVVQTATLLNAVSYPDHSSITVDLGPDPRPHNRLDLTIAMNKTDAYLRDVQILSSDDAYKWGKVGGGKIFAYKYEQFNQIIYPTSTMRYVRVDIMKQPGEADLRVTSAQILFMTGNIYQGQLLDTQLVSERSDRNTTLIMLDLGVPNYLITQVQIEAKDRNFDRNVSILSSGQVEVAGQEDQLAAERIITYQWNDYDLVKDKVSVYRFSRRYLIVSILNQDSPPLEIQSVKVFGAAPLVLADVRASSTIWYGNPQALKPDYDLAQFAGLISKSGLPIISVGIEQQNPDYEPPTIPWTERNRWLLNWAIVLVGGGFAVLILAKLKQLNIIHKEE